MKTLKQAFCVISRIALMACLCLVALPVMADDVPDYEIEGAGTGVQGTYLVKVSVLSKKAKVSDEEIGRAAVHGVLFRGFSNKELRQQQKPLASSAMAEMQHKDFFKDFFSDAFKNYYQLVGPRQVVKAGKQYKVTSVVTVAKDQLKKDLMAMDIIKGLNTGF